jgi:hypothetical protein
MAKILVNFQLSHGQGQMTQGNIVVNFEPGHSNLHEQVIKLIASQFNCPSSIISITEIKVST